METGDSLEADEGWQSVKRLIELAKRAPVPPLTAERKRQIRQRLLQRLERDRLERLARPAPWWRGSC